MWELDHKESWVLKNWYFQIVVLEKILESPLECKEIKPVNPKGNQPWIFTGRIDAEAEVLKLATWWEESTHWKRPQCWERLRAGEGDREWDGWMAPLFQWIRVWKNSGRWWRVGKPGQWGCGQIQLSNWTRTIRFEGDYYYLERCVDVPYWVQSSCWVMTWIWGIMSRI